MLTRSMVSASTSATEKQRATLRILRSSFSRCSRVSCFESLRPMRERVASLTGRMTAAATTGPKRAPRPTSSTPAMRLEAAVAEGLLGGVAADELLEHPLLGSGFGDAGDFGDVEERGHGVRPVGA